MAEGREKAEQVSVEKKKEMRPLQKKVTKQEREDNENLEEGLVLLEEKIFELDKRLLEVEDLEVMQQLYKEKENLEQRWEELCDRLEA